MINHMAFESTAESYWASAGFSGIFGKNNWTYWSHHGGDWELNFDPASDRWSNPLNCVVGNNYQAPAMNCDADRKWVAPHDGTVRVEGTASIDGTDAAGFGARIMKNADTIWSAQLTSSDKTASSHDQVVAVHAGDSISFVVHKQDLPKGKPASEASNAKIVWDPVITYVAP